MDLLQLIEKGLKEKKISASEASRRAVGKGYENLISRMRNDKTHPTFDKVVALFRVLGIPYKIGSEEFKPQELDKKAIENRIEELSEACSDIGKQVIHLNQRIDELKKFL